MRKTLIRRVILRGINSKTEQKEFIIVDNFGLFNIFKSYFVGTIQLVKRNIPEDKINYTYIYSKYVCYFIGFKNK